MKRVFIARKSLNYRYITIAIVAGCVKQLRSVGCHCFEDFLFRHIQAVFFRRRCGRRW